MRVSQASPVEALKPPGAVDKDWLSDRVASHCKLLEKKKRSVGSAPATDKTTSVSTKPLANGRPHGIVEPDTSKCLFQEQEAHHGGRDHTREP